jgi:hypothetical protein
MTKPAEPIQYSIEEGTIADLKEDPANARRHTDRGTELIEEGMQEAGAARSIFVWEDNTIGGGHGATQAAANVGIENVLFVDVPGNVLVAVRRSGLTPRQKTRLALIDNRASELSDFDPAKLAALAGDPEALLYGIFSLEEIDEQEARALIEAADEDDTDLSDALNFGEEGVKPARKKRGQRRAFRLDFATNEQKQRFDAFRRYLKKSYTDVEDEAERFHQFFADVLPYAVGIKET